MSAPPGREFLAQLLIDVFSGQMKATEDMPVMADVLLKPEKCAVTELTGTEFP